MSSGEWITMAGSQPRKNGAFSAGLAGALFVAALFWEPLGSFFAPVFETASVLVAWWMI
jgi:hypothetical protein